MPRLSLLIATIPILSLYFSSPAWSQESVEAQRCNGEIRASAQEQIASCSALIDSHSFNSKTLAIIYSNRGIIWLEQFDYYKAIVDFGEAIALDPLDATSYYHRGLAKLKVGDLAGSKADINRAGDLNPEFHAAESIKQTAAPTKPVVSERKPKDFKSEKSDKHSKNAISHNSRNEVSHKRGKAEGHEKGAKKVAERRHHREVSDAPVAAQPPSGTSAPGISLFGLTLGVGGLGGPHW